MSVAIDTTMTYNGRLNLLIASWTNCSGIADDFGKQVLFAKLFVSE